VLIGSAVALAVLELPVWAVIALFYLAGGLQWPGAPPPPPNPWTLPLVVWFFVNLISVLAGALRYRTYGFWLFVVVQAVNAVVFFSWAAQSQGYFWWPIASAAALVAAALMLLVRYARALAPPGP
jgi:hypothetical protein